VVKQNSKIFTAQIRIKIMVSELKHIGYNKLSLLFGFKLFWFCIHDGTNTVLSHYFEHSKVWCSLNLKSHVDITHKKTFILSDHISASDF